MNASFKYHLLIKGLKPSSVTFKSGSSTISSAEPDSNGYIKVDDIYDSYTVTLDSVTYTSTIGLTPARVEEVSLKRYTFYCDFANISSVLGGFSGDCNSQISFIIKPIDFTDLKVGSDTYSLPDDTTNDTKVMVNPVVSIANVDGKFVNCSITVPTTALCVDGTVTLTRLMILNDYVTYSLSMMVDSVNFVTVA